MKFQVTGIESHFLFFLLERTSDISDYSMAKYKLLIFGKLKIQLWASALLEKIIFFSAIIIYLNELDCCYELSRS